MCGRFSLFAPPDEIARIIALLPEQVRSVTDSKPRFNVAPTTPVAAVRKARQSGEKEIVSLRWGLVPSWAKEVGSGPLLINARAETVAEKPSFRSPFKNQRCLVLADGFFEWRRLDDRKQPYHFQVDGGAVFAFAGIWDRWQRGEDDPVESCAILTTRANELTALVHERMPVILPNECWEMWLGTGDEEPADPAELKSLLKPFPADRLTVFPVSTVVNSPRNNVPECLEPTGPELTVS